MGEIDANGEREEVGAHPPVAERVMRGPLLMTTTGRAPLGVNDGGWQAELKLVKPETTWGAWELTLRKGGETRTVRVADFATATDRNDPSGWFSIWF